MGLLARSHGRQAIHPLPEGAEASKAQPAGPGVGRWRLTFLFVVTALLATTVAIMVVNRIAGDFAQASLIKSAEADTVRDALHMQVMMRRGQTMQGMPSGSGDAAVNEEEVKPLTLEYLTGPEGLYSYFHTFVRELDLVKVNLFDPNRPVAPRSLPAEPG